MTGTHDLEPLPPNTPGGYVSNVIVDNALSGSRKLLQAATGRVQLRLFT